MDKVVLWTKTGHWCKGFMVAFFMLQFLTCGEDPTRLGFLNIFILAAVVLFVWAFVQARVGEKVLVTKGIFKYTRHPMYLSVLMVNIAYWLQVEVWTSPLFLLLEVLFLASLAAAVYCQEREVRERFGEDAARYHESTPRFPSYTMIKEDLKEPTSRLASQARNLQAEHQSKIPSYSTVKVGVKDGVKGRFDRMVSKAKAVIAALKE